MDRHYLLYALSGLLRIEADGKIWTLPPARAALIRAGFQVRITVLSRLQSASVLFDPEFIPLPKEEFSVFDVSRLAVELIQECREWTSDVLPLNSYAKRIFGALGEVACHQAMIPTRCVLPAPSSAELRRAIQLTESTAHASPSFRKIARDTGQSPRALARRFSDELGMTWSEFLRRTRVIHAVEGLAQSRASVTEIAALVGYSSLSGFNAAFRELMGMSPTQYRASFNE
jgi:AraC-like DNA-binding protein